MMTQPIYMLTAKQYFRRSLFLTALAGTGFLAYELPRQYIIHKSDNFIQEYDDLKENANFWHGLHEQVSLGFNEKSQIDKENDIGILELR